MKFLSSDIKKVGAEPEFIGRNFDVSYKGSHAGQSRTHTALPASAALRRLCGGASSDAVVNCRVDMRMLALFVLSYHE